MIKKNNVAVAVLFDKLGVTDLSIPKKERMFKAYLIHEFTNQVSMNRAKMAKTSLLMMIGDISNDGVYRFSTPRFQTSISHKTLREINYEKIMDETLDYINRHYDYYKSEIRRVPYVRRYKLNQRKGIETRQ